jgi:hypothetical protein
VEDSSIKIACVTHTDYLSIYPVYYSTCQSALINTSE